MPRKSGLEAILAKDAKDLTSEDLKKVYGNRSKSKNSLLQSFLDKNNIDVKVTNNKDYNSAVKNIAERVGKIDVFKKEPKSKSGKKLINSNNTDNLIADMENLQLDDVFDVETHIAERKSKDNDIGNMDDVQEDEPTPAQKAHKQKPDSIIKDDIGVDKTVDANDKFHKKITFKNVGVSNDKPKVDAKRLNVAGKATATESVIAKFERQRQDRISGIRKVKIHYNKPVKVKSISDWF